MTPVKEPKSLAEIAGNAERVADVLQRENKRASESKTTVGNTGNTGNSFGGA
jgi:hypothetical protein